jgi:catechol 2,3-dioxygenase
LVQTEYSEADRLHPLFSAGNPVVFDAANAGRKFMPDIASNNPIKPLGVGEVAIRVADLPRSIAFYRDVLGLQLIRVMHDAIGFMRVAGGVEGHTQIIGLFSHGWPSNIEGKRWEGTDPRRSTLHHFAIEISLKAYAEVLEYLTRRGLTPYTQTHPWIGWRSIYVSDPDENTVEFVCYDPSTLDT